MIKFISLLLCTVMLCAVIISTASCAGSSNEPTDKETTGDAPTADSPNDGDSEIDSIISPSHRDYGREAVNFADITYSRPNVEELLADFRAATELVSKENTPYNDKLDAILALEDGFSDFNTMFAYANIMQSKNTADQKWLTEYSYLTSCEPELMQTVDELFVAAATSGHCERFEEDYFGEGALEEYKSGSKYTDELVILLEEEAELENTYSALSTATVEITYNGQTATVDEHLKAIDEALTSASKRGPGKDNDALHAGAKGLCLAAYKRKYNDEAKKLLVSLIKIRSKIADEYGYESYAEVAYQQYDRDYTEHEATKLIENVSKYIRPVYDQLNLWVFLPYFNSIDEKVKANASEVINSLYEVYEDTDETLLTAYSYMLEFGLYDYSPASVNRFEGSFTTYLEKYDSPYVFISAEGTGDDYMTLAHEFGHYYGSYTNYNSPASLDLSEVSSTALEFISLLALEDTLDEQTYRYIYYTKLNSALQALIFQGYYALFEHYAYDIPYDMISEKTLSEAASKAALDIGLPNILTLDAALIPHTMLYPFYVQSYCTATAVALEIFYTEQENEGAGLSSYKSLVLRETEGLSFSDELKEAGLASPFTGDTMMKLADKIHFDVIGKHYYKESDYGNNAA